MDPVFYTYTYSSGAWMGLQGMTLMVMPKLIIASLLDETRPASLLEIYFARSCGMSLIAIAIMSTILTGSIPLTSSYAVTAEESDPEAPYAYPMLMVTSGFHTAVALYAYAWYTFGGQAGFAIGMAVAGALASTGIWCMLFANTDGKISGKTGADKRLSGFPFGNLEADKKRKGKKKGL